MRKPIKGFEGLYEVDDNGNIYTTRRQGSAGGIVKAVFSTGGYARVKLSVCSKRLTLLVHRIVAEAFIPNPHNYPCVNHKDGNKRNNSVENLEWCTYSQNMKHAVSHGLAKIPGLNGDKSPARKVSWEIVREIRKRYSDGETFSKLGKDYGISKEQVINIVKRKNWKEDLEVCHEHD